MKKFLLILLLLFGFGISNDFSAQEKGRVGGKKKEKTVKGKKRGDFNLHRWRSMGHADKFARGNSGRRGLIARIFKKPKPAWVYKSSGSRRSHYKANQFLFGWLRTKGKEENEFNQNILNKERKHSRVRGNKVFHKRKFKSR